jgi:hypothetical protein
MLFPIYFSRFISCHDLVKGTNSEVSHYVIFHIPTLFVSYPQILSSAFLPFTNSNFFTDVRDLV